MLKLFIVGWFWLGVNQQDKKKPCKSDNDYIVPLYYQYNNG